MRPWQAGAVLLAAAATAHAGPVLSVDEVKAPAAVVRPGESSALTPGDVLRQGDVIQIGPGGHLRLRFAGHGFIELGPGTELALEQLPFASYAADLNTVFGLHTGYMRTVWKHVAVLANWPLHVNLGATHLSLASGEYFFLEEADTHTACVAAGELNLHAGQSDLVPLAPPACYRFSGGALPQRSVVDVSTWRGARAGFRLPVDGGEAVATAGPAMPAQPPPTAGGPPVAIAPATAGTSSPVPSAAAPAVAASPSPVTVPSAGKSWSLVVKSFTAQAQAGDLASRMQAQGYKADVIEATVSGAKWFRVELRGYASQAAAHAALLDVQTHLGLQSMWVVATGGT